MSQQADGKKSVKVLVTYRLREGSVNTDTASRKSAHGAGPQRRRTARRWILSYRPMARHAARLNWRR